MKTVVLSRFLRYLTIINAIFEDDEHYYKCHYELSYNQYVFTKRNLQMPKSENCRCFVFSQTWRHLGIAQTSLALLSVCTSFPR